MPVVFKPTSAAAVLVKKQAERLGLEILAGKIGCMTRIVDGFILRAIRISPDTAVVTAIDMPRYYACPRLRSAATEGTTMVIRIEVPDALAYLIDGYPGGPPSTLPTEGYYSSKGITYVGDQIDERASLAVRAGPAVACRTALLVVDSIGIVGPGPAVVGFTFQVNRVNAGTSWTDFSPPGSSIDRLPMDPAAQLSGGPAVIEINPDLLGILALQPHTSALNKVVAGPALEVNKSLGFLTGSALFEAGFIPTTSIGRIDERCIVARYSVSFPEPIDGEPQPYEGLVDWAISIEPSNVPVDNTEHVLHSPHIWGAWSVFADTPPAPEESLAPLLILAGGSYKEVLVDSEVTPAEKWTSYVLRLVVNASTGTYDQEILSTFDGSTLEYTDLEEEQYIPILPFTHEGDPCILCAKRITRYELVSSPGLLDRKHPVSGSFYTELDDLSYHIVTRDSVDDVTIDGYYVAVGARFIAPTVSGSGRYAYTGPFVNPAGATLPGNYWPVDGSDFNGGNPIGSAVCLCAPGVLAMVVSPVGQYLSATQDRYVVLYHVTTDTVLGVSSTPVLDMAYSASVLLQLTCLEQGEEADGVMTRLPVLLLTVGEMATGEGVHVTYDAGETFQKILDYPNQYAAYYVGSATNPAAIGISAGNTNIRPRLV